MLREARAGVLHVVCQKQKGRHSIFTQNFSATESPLLRSENLNNVFNVQNVPAPFSNLGHHPIVLLDVFTEGFYTPPTEGELQPGYVRFAGVSV